MFTDHQAFTSLMKDKKLSRQQMRWVQKLIDFNFKIMYWSDKQNIKIDALTCRVNVVLKDFENERIHYQRIIILTLKWMKIADLKKNISALIYKQILEINEIDENCMLLREAIARDEITRHKEKISNWRIAELRMKSCIMIVLRVCRNWIRFSSQQALEILTHVESLVSTLYSSAFDTRANLLRSLCFALL